MARLSSWEFGAQLKKRLTRWSSYKFLRDAHLPSPKQYRLGTPDVNRFRGLLVHHCYDLLSCSPPNWRLLLPGFQWFWSPSPLPDMTTVATGQFPPAGLSPAGSAASVAAHCFRFHNQQRITPIAEPSTCQNPKAPIGVSQARPRMPTLQHH